MTYCPLISIVMPVFNTEKYLVESINSVLNQTYQNIELICVNDGSTDNSLDILKSFNNKIKIHDNKINCGIGEARNNGIILATGSFLAFMDADDIWQINKLEIQMEQFNKNQNLDISFTHTQCFLSSELSDTVKSQRYCPPLPMPGYLSVTALIKMKSFKKVGYFEPKWKVGEFIDWFNRAKEAKLNFKMIEDILHLRRIHESNTGIIQRDARSDYLKIAREALNRRKEKI